LPFVAVSAAAAPLLGLLGTVTGIIKTFQLITVFGSGDVKSLSGGISEALITTKYGLIVAIPSLLIHAFLSRKAKGVIGRMETEAVAFANEISRLREDRVKRWRTAQSPEADAPASPDPDLVRTQVKEILNDILGPLVAESAGSESLAQSGNAYPG
jgi:biopolymer transport protein ExbB